MENAYSSSAIEERIVQVENNIQIMKFCTGRKIKAK